MEKTIKQQQEEDDEGREEGGGEVEEQEEGEAEESGKEEEGEETSRQVMLKGSKTKNEQRLKFQCIHDSQEKGVALNTFHKTSLTS